MIEGKLDAHFPLRVWQTGSGTQTNMNANEVISNRAIEIAGGEMGFENARPSERRCEQIAVVERYFPDGDVHCGGRTLDRADPEVQNVHDAIKAKAKEFEDVVKIGRTHLQDATPVTVGQEFGGWASLIDRDIERLKMVLPGCWISRSAERRSARA